jgi:hypothetical protein
MHAKEVGMAEAGEQTDELGTVYQVRYADGERAFFTEPDYQRERQDADAPERIEAHRIVAADAYREARFEAHYGWWMPGSFNSRLVRGGGGMISP